MRVWGKVFWAPKQSCADEEYEDAYAWWPRRRQLSGVIRERFRFAVADGATASSYSRQWANQLALGFVTGKLREDNFAEALAFFSRRWQEKAPKQALSWWAEQSLERGAFAALVGLTLEESRTHASTWSWRALAVGDSCVVHMRGRTVKAMFPIERADQFGATPILVSTNPSAVHAAIADRKVMSSSGTDGDRFYLMTDALAQWFLAESEQGGEPWDALDDLASDPDAPPFREWLSGLRRASRIRNDDVTLLRIEVE